MALVDQTEIKFCRVCLAVDVKMYEMKEYRLSEMFQNITGIPACDETERVLHRVCWECAARLSAASAFRNKALLTDTLLKDVVHRNKRNIEQLRQYYSYLKSPLTVQTVFTSADIECEDTPIELHSNETEKRKVYKRRRKRKSNEEGTVFDEEEPLVEFSIKTEVESDPFAENNINNRIKVENSETISQVIHFDDSFTPSKDDNEDEIRNTEELMNEKSEDIEMMAAPVTYGINLVEDNGEKQPTIDVVNQVFDEPSSEDTGMNNRPNDDRDIVLEDDNVEENPVLDGIGNISDSSSSEEDRQSLAELVSVKKAKKQTSKKVGASGKRLNDGEKQKIIAMKEKGLSLREISKKTGKSRKTVRRWWNRWCNERNLTNRKIPGKRRTTTAQEDQLILDRVSQSQGVHTPSLAKELGLSAGLVRRRLKEAGYSRSFIGPYIPLKQGRNTKIDEDLKERIITMRQNGVPVTEMAMKFRVARTTIYQWWRQWCKENNMETTDNNTNDSIEEEQTLAEDAKNMDTSDSITNYSSEEEQPLAEDAKHKKIDKTPKRLSKKRVLDSKVEITKQKPRKLPTKKALGYARTTKFIRCDFKSAE